MKRAVVAGTLMLVLAGLGPSRPALAQNAAPTEDATPAPNADTAPRPHVHQPARVRVHPLAQSTPGPESVRQCSFWLATEYRPGGTVIVPQMHCWWERG